MAFDEKSHYWDATTDPTTGSEGVHIQVQQTKKKATRTYGLGAGSGFEAGWLMRVRCGSSAAGEFRACIYIWYLSIYLSIYYLSRSKNAQTAALR
jgi:hypothetical protein